VALQLCVTSSWWQKCSSVTLWQLSVTGLSPRSRVFDPRSDHVRFVVDKMALWEVSLPVLQFSPVSTIPPMLHTHSFNYHPRYTMFLSQYFRFPLSVPFHQCPIPIHSPTTHAIQCFSPSTSVFPCQYHSTNDPSPFIHLQPTLYNVCLPVLQFSPVSTIPPMLHTHSFTHHPRYIMFLSQYFSFPLSVLFHQCFIPIHSPTTHII